MKRPIELTTKLVLLQPYSAVRILVWWAVAGLCISLAQNLMPPDSIWIMLIITWALALFACFPEKYSRWLLLLQRGMTTQGKLIHWKSKVVRRQSQDSSHEVTVHYLVYEYRVLQANHLLPIDPAFVRGSDSTHLEAVMTRQLDTSRTRVFQNTKNQDHPNTEVDPVAKAFLHLSPVTRRVSKYRYQKLIKLEGQLTEAEIRDQPCELLYLPESPQESERLDQLPTGITWTGKEFRTNVGVLPVCYLGLAVYLLSFTYGSIQALQGLGR